MESQVTNSMPQYQSSETVWARKITAVCVHADPDPAIDNEAFIASDEFQGGHLFLKGYPPLAVGADWFREYRPKPGGYYVVHPLGYTMFSPAEEFEKDYSPI